MKEIERKFLVHCSPPAELQPLSCSLIQQAYLSIDPVEVRVRSQWNEFHLTVKSKGGLERTEITRKINSQEWGELCGLAPWYLNKIRTCYAIPGGVAEGDWFPRLNLKLVEVEFPTAEAAAAFQPPDWFGTEVTYDERYRNSALAVNGAP